jgi:ribonuclease HII
VNWFEQRVSEWHKKNGPLVTDQDEFTLAKHMGMSLPLFRRCRQKLPKYILGIDEVGRGAYAGPLVVGAVLAPFEWNHPSLCDSKAAKGSTSAKKEEARAQILKELETAPGARYFLQRTSHTTIDYLGGIGAALHASFRSLMQQFAGDDVLLVLDGDEHMIGFDHVALVKGDSIVPHCMAASLVAKVSRDTEMSELGKQFPGYGFERHKGYGTPVHEEALRTRGPCPIHRKTVKPVQSASTT